MNTIPINEIAPSPNPVRKTWDEDKMEELAQSIRERGVIVPIKVRPNGKGYEVVYGHRRVEAARRAGLEDMPAIVEGVDKDDVLIEALIENVIREDMLAIDIATALHDLKLLTKWTNNQIAQQLGWKDGRGVSNYLVLLDLPIKLQSVGVQHVIQAKAGTDNLDDAARVLEKAEREELSSDETRKVAESYRAAVTPELKQKVLETSGKLGDSERILMAARMKLGGDKMMERKEYERQKAFEEYDQAVKDFIDAARLFDRMIKTARNATKYGKFSPEGARFTVRKIDQLIYELEQLKEVLNDVS